MVSGPEDQMKHRLKGLKPNDVYWYTIPTQIGRFGLKPPFDVSCCVAGWHVALELKWMKGWKGLEPHQLIAIGEVNHAGGYGLCVDGRVGGDIRVYDVSDLGTEYWETTVDEFWSDLSNYV